MTKDEIIKLAREAGGTAYVNRSAPDDPAFAFGPEKLQAFARACYEAGRTAEREECAKVCDEKATHCEKKAQEAIESGEYDEVSAIRSTAWQISFLAADIRARGKP